MTAAYQRFAAACPEHWLEGDSVAVKPNAYRLTAAQRKDFAANKAEIAATIGLLDASAAGCERSAELLAEPTTDFTRRAGEWLATRAATLEVFERVGA